MEHNRSLKRLEKISQTINWSKVEEILMSQYTVGSSREGADAFSPLMLLKGLLLQKWCRIDSDPELENQIDDLISFKKFMDLSFDQHSPERYRRALYLASDTGRQWDPQLAKVYYDQMVCKGNCHTQAVCAVSTHLVGRIIRVLKDKRPYELRDLEGKPITKKEAKILIKRELTVPEEARKRTRSRRKTKRYKRNQIRGIAQKQSSGFAPYPS